MQPQVEGIVRQVFVRAGDRVGAGQPLIQIDPDKQQATNTVTESQRASREADLAYAKQQLARMQKLFDAGAVSRAELEQAETAHKNAEAQLAAVQSQIRENQVELQYYRVTAPSAGIVGEVVDPPGRPRHPVDGDHDDRSAGRARGLHQRAARARDGPASRV